LLHSHSIVDIFLENTAATREAVEQAMAACKETGEPVGQVLVNMGIITEKERVKCQGQQWGIPFVDLEEIEILDELLHIIPPHMMRQYKAVPIRLEGRRLTVAMGNPTNVLWIDELKLITGYNVVSAIACEEDIDRALKRVGSAEDALRAKISDVLSSFGPGEGAIEAKATEDEPDPTVALHLAEDAPIIKLVNTIIAEGLRESASDIHVQPEEDRVRVRYRVDGILADAPIPIPKQVQSPLISRIKIMAEMDIAERRVPQDGRISLAFEGREYDFRVSSLPGVNGEKMVLRVLDKSGISLGLEKLGFAPDTMERFSEVISRSWGIILVTGPTGSGKSTTLYSVLSRKNSGQECIITVEDPVEYQLPGLTQAHVNVKAGLTFASVLRSMLRQDPDIIMVGEIRDRETAVIATEAALTGHLVFSTLHTNDAPGAVARLGEMQIEPFLIASAVQGVLAQRLLRTVCSKCAEPYQPPEKSLRRIRFPKDQMRNARFMRGRGCEACRQRGYRGRTGCYEFMVVTDEIREAILKEEPSHVIAEISREQGMRTLAEDAMLKVAQGITTPEEMLRVCST